MPRRAALRVGWQIVVQQEHHLACFMRALLYYGVPLAGGHSKEGQACPNVMPTAEKSSEISAGHSQKAGFPPLRLRRREPKSKPVRATRTRLRSNDDGYQSRPAPALVAANIDEEVVGEGGLRVADNAGRAAEVPGDLADRVRAGRAASHSARSWLLPIQAGAGIAGTVIGNTSREKQGREISGARALRQ